MVAVAVAYPALVMIVGAIVYWKYPVTSVSKPALTAFAIGLFFVVQTLAHTTAKL